MLLRNTRRLFSKNKYYDKFRQRIETIVEPLRPELENFSSTYMKFENNKSYFNLKNFIQVKYYFHDINNTYRKIKIYI